MKTEENLPEKAIKLQNSCVQEKSDRRRRRYVLWTLATRLQLKRPKSN